MTTTHHTDGTDGICVVCQEVLGDEIPTATTPCNHVLHSICLLRASLSSDTCPVCRASFYPSGENSAVGEIETEVDIFQIGDLEEIHVNESPDLRHRILRATIFKACREGNLEEVRELLGDDESLARAEDDSLDTLLHMAMSSGSDNLVRFLINEAGIRVNSTNVFRMTPLHYTMSSDVNASTVLLNCGAYVDPQDSAGKTPLMIACIYNNVAVVKLLLDRGASPRMIDSSGDTCLHHSARGRCIRVLRLLLRRTTLDPNFCNFLGETALHLSCASASFTSVKFLLDSGADPSLQAKSGKTAEKYIPRGNTRIPALFS
jgi:ankyrin repeat protein